MVSLQHISKSFGAQKVLNDVSLEIPAGQIVGLLGPNGAGKSTLMKILIGLWSADSGTVSAPSRIGYLPENNPLYEDMYVTEYLSFMAQMTYSASRLSTFDFEHGGLPVAVRIEQGLSTLIDLVGLSPERHKHIRELSKGYRQRVGIAQALLGDPELLILDEPTTGLDPNQLVEIRALIKSLSGGAGLSTFDFRLKSRSVILSTHILQEVREMCDRVIILDHGTIKADLPIDQIPDLETLFHEATK